MKLVYFAWVRERIGTPEEEVDPPASAITVADLIAWLRTRGDVFEAAFSEPAVIRTAIDQIHADHDTPIAGAREIAFFPPMTGG